MARNDSDNFYRRQQEEANRIAAKQHRVLTDIAKLAKSSNEELRKFRKAFEAFAEAIRGMKIEPFQGAVLSEAAREQIAEFDIKGFKEALLNGEALITPGGDPVGKPVAVRVPEGKPYPSFDLKPDETKKRIAHVERTPRLGYGDVVADNEDFIAHEREAAIENGEHPPTLDGMEDIDLPACGFCGDDIGAPGCPAHGEAEEVLPPGVTPKMMADHPEFAERVRNSPHYHQANQEASRRTHEVRILADGTGIIPTEPGEDIPVTQNGKEIGRATINEDGTGTISIDGEKALPTSFASGGYTGVGLSENVMGGIVHQGIFSDAARRRRDGLASY